MPQTERQHQRRPGRDGIWPGTWETTSAPRSSRRWRPGWDREEPCPPDPMRRGRGRARTLGAAPEGGWCRGEHWRQAWEDTRRVARTLRRSGYVARWRWERVFAEERKIGRNVIRLDRYTEGPAAGHVAADPWDLARALSGCCSSWYTQLRQDAKGRLVLVKVPRQCGRRHVCPTCAQRTSSSLATAIRAVVEERHQAGDLGPLALVTMTQRVSMDEDLGEALARLRDAFARLTRDDPELRRVWGDLVAGWYLGFEVTRTWNGKGTGTPEPEAEAALGWHAHAHLVIELDPAALARLRSDGYPDPVAGARELLGRAWQTATGRAALEAGLPGHGWDPVAGGCAPLEARGGEPGTFDFKGGWWRPIDPTAPEEVYQAAKYPTPLTTLGPVGLAEFVAVAYGRNWHQGGGSLRSVRKEAAEIERNGPPAVTAPDGSHIAPPDLGDLISRCGPQESPPAEPDPEDLTWTWRLRGGSLAELDPAVTAAIVGVGGHVWPRLVHRRGEEPEHQVWATIPAPWCWPALEATETAIVEYHQRIADARDQARGSPT